MAVTYRHYRVPLGRDEQGGKLYHPGAMTVAVVKWPKEYGTGPLAAVGFSFCAPDDQFNRMTGRTKADLRVWDNDQRKPEYHVRVSAPDGCQVESFILDAFNKLKKRGVLPHWVERQYQQYWKLIILDGERKMKGGQDGRPESEPERQE